VTEVQIFLSNLRRAYRLSIYQGLYIV